MRQGQGCAGTGWGCMGGTVNQRGSGLSVTKAVGLGFTESEEGWVWQIPIFGIVGIYFILFTT